MGEKKKRSDKWKNIPVPKELIDRVDKEVEKHRKKGEIVSRANLIRNIIVDWMEKNERPT